MWWQSARVDGRGGCWCPKKVPSGGGTARGDLDLVTDNVAKEAIPPNHHQLHTLKCSSFSSGAISRSAIDSFTSIPGRTAVRSYWEKIKIQTRFNLHFYLLFLDRICWHPLSYDCHNAMVTGFHHNFETSRRYNDNGRRGDKLKVFANPRLV